MATEHPKGCLNSVWPPLEISNEPPVDGSSFTLHPGESVMFYQRSQFAHYLLLKLESEVVVTQRRVIVTETRSMRGPLPLKLRRQQRALDKQMVRGYEAGELIPTIPKLLFWLLLCAMCVLFIREGPVGSAYRILHARHGVAVVLRLFGGPCTDIGRCPAEKLEAERSRIDGQVRRYLNDHRPVAEPKPAPEAANASTTEPMSSPESSTTVAAASAGRRDEAAEPSGEEPELTDRLTLEAASPTPPGSNLQLAARAGTGPHARHRNRANSVAARSGTELVPVLGLVAGTAFQSGVHLLATHLAAQEQQRGQAAASGACEDFPGWRDFDGNQCSRYAERDWAYSCLQADVVANSQAFASRRDSTRLELSVLESCCICGGGAHTGRGLAVRRLTGVLWPIVEAAGAGAVTKAPSEVVALAGSAAGQGEVGLQQHLAALSDPQLLDYGVLLAPMQTDGIVTGEVAWPSELTTMLVELLAEPQRGTGESATNQTQLSLAAAPPPLLPGFGSPLAEAQEEAWLRVLGASVAGLRLGACLWHALWVLVLMYGVSKSFFWLAARLRPKQYVQLKRHEDYFGEGAEVGRSAPMWMMCTGAHSWYAFFLPCPEDYPDRLAAFAAALVVDVEAAAAGPC